MLLTDIMSIINIILGFLGAYYSYIYYKRFEDPWRWTKIMYIFICLYWAGIYIFVTFLAQPDSINSAAFGQIFIRPAITVTLAAITASAILRIKKEPKQ